MSPENLGAEATPQGASTDAGSVSLEQLLESSDFVPSDEQLGLGGEGDEGETTKVDVKEEVKDVKEEREEKEETKEGEEKKEAKTVPLAALHEERERRKELTKRLEESERQHATEIGTLTERINIILNSLQQQQTDRTQQTQQQKDIAELPDFIRSYAAANPYAQEKEILDAFFREEPTNYLNWQNQRILKAQEAIAERNKLQDEQERARTQFNNFMGEYRNNVNTFTAENADFPSAYNFLLNQRQQELTVM